MDHGNIYLVGMMGAGKSTVGKTLARRLSRPFVDTDREIVERTGVPIATIFEIEGEPCFRRRESAVLADLAAGRDAVVATGGGAILAEANRTLMRQSGFVIYLHASLDHLHERTRRDAGRPLLAQGDRRAILASLLEARDPLYREAAHLVIESGSPSAGALATRIMEALDKHRREPEASNP